MAAASLLICGGHTASAQPALREEPLVATSGDVRLDGTVLLPASVDDAALPGLVLVHGAGPGERSSVRAEAEAFARAGIATYIYDKRTEGYSLTDRNFGLLARDALAAARALATHPSVRDDAVGLWGLSEGAWVVPLAATAPSADAVVDFVVLAAATGVTPASQHAWFLEGELRRRGVSGAPVEAVTWRGMQLLIGFGAFPEPFHDPVPPLRRITVPLLAVWGADDVIEPAGASVGIVLDAVSGPSPGATLVVFDDATHDITRSDDPALLVHGYPQLVADWVGEVADGRVPSTSVIGSPPPLEHDVPTVRRAQWWAGAPAQLVVWLTLTGGFGWLAARGGRWTDGRRRGLAVRVTGLLGVACLLGLPGYVMTVLVSDASVVGPVVGSSPLVWTVLQVTGVGTVLGTVHTAATIGGTRDRSGRRRAWRASLLVVLATIFVGWTWWWRLLSVPS